MDAPADDDDDGNTDAELAEIKRRADDGDEEAAKTQKRLEKLERKRQKLLKKHLSAQNKNKVGKREQHKAGLRKLSFGFGLVSYQERKKIIKEALDA